jgi:ABC-2 type transport system permease protein
MRTLLRLEILRILRNRRYLFFTIVYPVGLFAIMAGSYGNHQLLPGIDARTYFMVAMATFGTVGAALNTALRISTERKAGWVRQLRLTSLPSWGYVAAKIGAAAAATLPAILAVFVLAAAEGVRLSALTWVGLVLALWVGAFVFSALGVAIGYMAPPDGVQPIVMIFYIGMAFLGGTWFAITGTFGKIAGWTPIALYNELGRNIETGASVNVGHMVALVGYLVVFVALASRLYQRDKQKI